MNTAGSPDPSPARREWTVDTVAPDTSLTGGPQGPTSSTAASFAFASPDGAATFQCRLGVAAFASCTSPASHSSLAQGPHAFEVRAVDAAGNTDQTPAHRDWTVDTIAPETAILTGPSGDTPAGPVDITFSSSEPDSMFACKIDTGPFEACSSPLSIPAPGTGPHSVQVRATDVAGNTDQTPATRDWITLAPDTSAPDTTILAAPTGRIAPGPVDITFQSSEAFSTFQCKIDAAAYTACMSPLHLESPALGPHTVYVQAIDAAGNPDPTPAIAEWKTVAPHIDLCGQIDSDRTIGPDEATIYVITCNLQIAAGRTLRLEPDTIIKATSGTGLTIGGSLVAAGTAASPVTFTSIRDDSVGGDTNGDGITSSPAAGDWHGIGVSGAQAHLRLDGGRVRFARVSTFDVAEVDVQRSRFERASGDALTINDGSSWPTPAGVLASVRVSDNVFTDATSRPLVITDSSATNAGLDLRLGLLQNNTGTGNGGGNQLLLDSWRVREDTSWGFGAGALQPVLSSTTTVPAGQTLTFPAGSTIKFATGCGVCSNLSVGGSLVAAGTAASPVTFTSIRDDSVGGDTNGDGITSSPAAGDWHGIGVSGAQAHLRLDGGRVRFARVSTFDVAEVDVQRSRFERASGDALTINDGSSWPTPAGVLASVRVSDNVFTDATSRPLVITDSSATNAGLDLRLGLLQNNTGTGNGGGNQLLLDSWRVREDTSWGFGAGALQPVLSSTTTVPAGQTLTFPAGSTIKFATGCGVCSNLSVGGSLVAAGTAASPVTFTSIRDDSVGGSVNGDGSVSSPAAGDWRGIQVSSGGTAWLEATTLRFASTALSVSTDGEARIRGSILNSSVGVSSDAFVDASNVDWGDPSGPAPYGSGTAIQGNGVMANPWVGYQPPPAPPAPAAPATVVKPPAMAACVLFVGVRGSGDAPQNGAPYDANFPERDMGGKIQTVFHKYRDRLQARGFDISDAALDRAAINYPAVSASNVANYITGAFIASYSRGVYELLRVLQQESGNCGGRRKFILAGYSQGALVIRLALGLLDTVPGVDKNDMLAVLLLADPAGRGDGDEIHIGDIDVRAEVHAQGVYERAVQGARLGMLLQFGAAGLVVNAVFATLNVADGAPRVPSALTGRTSSLCYKHDIVCAPGRGASPQVHSSYSDTDLNTLGTFAANQVPAS